MKTLIRFVVLTFLTISSLSMAHTGMRSSVPQDGSMLMAPPASLTINFSGSVRLIKVDMKNEHEQNIAVNFSPTTEAATSFDVPLPNLPAGTYRTDWTAMGSDGHKITGSIGFMLHDSEYSELSGSSKMQDMHDMKESEDMPEMSQHMGH